MAFNRQDVSEKLFQLLIPVMDKLKITDRYAVKDLCNRMMNHKSMYKIITLNAVKSELFDELLDMSKDIKHDLMTFKELQNTPVSELNNIGDSLLKVLVALSDHFTKEQYSFIIDINEHNDEYLIIQRKDSNIQLFKIVGIMLRQLVSDIISSLHNSVFLSPEKCVVFTLDNIDLDGHNNKIEIPLNLEDMLTITNLFTVTINTKFSRAVNMNIKFKIDPMDSPNPQTNKQRRDDFYKAISPVPVSEEDSFMRLSDIYKNEDSL